MLDEMKWRYRLAEIRAMMTAERRLLKAGAIDEIVARDRRRQTLADQLSEMPAAIAESHEALIEEIRVEAARNQSLLKAYIRGAGDAAARMQALIEKRGEIGAYRRDGSRLAGAAPGPTRESRA
ncbi:hypothetical protein G5B40_16950 [Pikeienuella piscinae]|uniref:Flagellar protein FlgN n=1 Tax=Pikeienuella piscinae TaxID=2748098 RepID=A0A7L5C1H1_9RHOB|nr:hypothetical protein [Pikeienuella piscinae]QIE56978.1 hypothetical protein G5B40_16950 [Pikeienuella piscinae]